MSLLVRDEGRVRYLTINRPQALNALNRQVIDQLGKAIDAVPNDPSIGVVVIDGGGERAFCAGADLTELSDLDADEAREVMHRGQRVFAAVEALPVPVIAAVDGFALGGGLELALCCPLIFASDRALFGLPEARLGLMPGYGGTQRLRRSIGRAPALHMMLTGTHIDAQRAWQLGMLSQPPLVAEHFQDAVFALATELARLSRSTAGLILEAGRPTPDGLHHEAALASIAISSPDGREGIRAFQDKRAAYFNGSGPAAGAAGGSAVTLSRYDDVAVGDRALVTRVVTNDMVRAFAELSGDHNPLHVDDDFAGKARWKRRLAHGALTNAFISAALTELSAGWIYVSQEIAYVRPVFPGETVTAEVWVAEKQPRNRIEVHTEVRCGAGDPVARGTAVLEELSEVFDESVTS
jgi:enoyl-CoA hydratase